MKNIFPTWGVIAHADKQTIEREPDYWRELLYMNKLLVIRGVGKLTPEEYWELHRVWGDPWNNLQYGRTTEKWRAIDDSRFYTEYGNIITKEAIGNRQMPWHRDIPWHREMRYPIRSLYPIRMTLGAGNTGTRFCDCDTLWERLTEQERHDLENTQVEIQNWYQFQHKFTTVARRWIPLVEQHPVTKRKSVLLNSFGPMDANLRFSTAPGGTWILNAKIGEEPVGLDWINRLHALACTEDNVYNHVWEEGDLVLFDNFSGVFHGRDRVVAQPNAERLFWRMNLHHRIQQ